MEANPSPPNLGVEAAAARRFRIAGDTVNKATAELPDEQRSLVRWFHAHCADEDLTLEEAGKLIRYDDSTLHRVFNGKYEGSLERVCEEISEFKTLFEERNKGRRLGFIETALDRKIWKVCDAALEFQRIAFLIGETQTGKTTALVKYRDDNNHGSTIYTSMPTFGFYGMYLAGLARGLRISTHQKEKDLVRRIIESFDDRMLLIVDEAHQCLYGTGHARGIRTLEFIREIHDATKCGLVICGTPVFDAEMESGGFAGFLKQCKRRRLCKLVLPSVPDAKDLDVFAAAYGLPPAAGEALKLQTEVLRDEALGMWLTLLRMGAKVASRGGKHLGWEHVAKAYAGLRELERGK